MSFAFFPFFTVVITILAVILSLAVYAVYRPFKKPKQVVLTASPNDGSLSMLDLIEAMENKPEFTSEESHKLDSIKIRIQFEIKN